MKDRWKIAFQPSQRLAIDETMVRLLQSFPFQQYNKSKPAKRGLKYFSMACSKNGYLLRSKLYRGKKSSYPTTPNGVVTNFIDYMKDTEKKFIYVFDNWFATYDLALQLSEERIPFVGTCRSNRPSWIWCLYFDFPTTFKSFTEGVIAVLCIP